ncbi:RnfABCDGE type electron transport complex subunit G [Clostridium tunisiense]|uniref:RnfABCDGE type electron transport complex subunit G n=1 Tax=Clostridium tunisiense TaxID=219748 RepID=UPI000300F185|nr:RnfABCDGE type electron transport complex subunit G [Clostridium tunisiense]
MKENLKLGIKLLVIAGIAGLLLGYAYEITKGPIEAKAKEEQSIAMKELLPAATDFKKSEKNFSSDSNISSIYEGNKNGQLSGYLFTVKSSGYGGPITMMIGISTEGKVEGVKILAHTETPGLGSNAEKPKFKDQFKGKSAEKELTVGSDIQAMTGSTITSKAVTSGVNSAIKFYNDQLKGAK